MYRYRNLRQPIILSALALLLVGCSGWSPVAVELMPTPKVSEDWQDGGSLPPGAPTQPASDAILPPWLPTFADNDLTELVQEALANNPDLNQVRARLREGDASAVIAGAAEALQVDTSLQAGRSRRSGVTSNGLSAELALSWEVDLWGRLSAASQAAVVDRDALQADLHGAELSLAANVAKAWFTAIESHQQLRLSERLVDNLAQSLDVLEEGYRNGIVAALDIHLARANLASERSRLASRKAQARIDTRVLEQLLGRYPGGHLPTPQQLPALPAAIPAGLPSQLLLRRPDLRAASARTESARLRQQARHADRFPRFSLTGALGGSSDELGQLLRSDSLVWSLFGQLAQPLTDGQRLEATEQQAAARLEQAQADYVALVLSAFAEVENALMQEQTLASQVAALNHSAQESDQADLLANEQYRQGLVDIVTVLEAQRRAFNARSALIEAHNRQLQNRINLYLALGGDIATDLEPGAGNAEQR